jgi:UDP-N-acetylmuramyl tripeptide synthase
MYNVYNALGAAAAARALGIPLTSIGAGLQSVTAAFGRMERIEIEGKTAYLALAKNPAGLNEVLRTLRDSRAAAHLLVLLNDNIADGRDVSWIWDADVEMLAGSVSSVVFSGQRAEDMALRFKYAGVIDAPEGPEWSVTHDTRVALERALALTPPGDTVCIVPTYTAMLEIRQVLTARGYVRAYWET